MMISKQTKKRDEGVNMGFFFAGVSFFRITRERERAPLSIALALGFYILIFRIRFESNETLTECP